MRQHQSGSMGSSSHTRDLLPQSQLLPFVGHHGHQIETRWGLPDSREIPRSTFPRRLTTFRSVPAFPHQLRTCNNSMLSNNQTNESENSHQARDEDLPGTTSDAYFWTVRPERRRKTRGGGSCCWARALGGGMRGT